MASTSDYLYVTYVDFDRDLLKIWGQRNRIAATYIERQLLQLLPEFNKTASPNPNRIQKGMFCFAKYTDDNYYRARVISRVQGDSVCVLFVDYGNRDTIKLSNIRIQEGDEGDILVKMSEQAEEYYLARIAAPPLGWTREILSEIRRDICYDEFHYQIVEQIGDQKILNVQFRNEDFSNYLVKKQLARPLQLPVQREMILSYCSLVSNSVKRDDTFKDTPPRLPFSPSVPPPGLRAPIKPANFSNELNMQLNFGKANSPVNFPCPPPSVQYPPARNVRAPFQQIEPNIPKNSFYHPMNQINSQMPIDPVPLPQVNPNVNPLLNHPLFQYYQIQEGRDSCMNNVSDNHNNNNNKIIEILAQQVKQYIAKDYAKSETETEDTPHHYVNSVLEVGNTYNVIISYIDDGPWSFSVQLLSSESELQKLMDELSTVKLVPIKPPIILGHPCIGSSALYGNLCRGVIVSISRSAVKVYFVDFGNTEDLPVSSIYELPPKFFKTRVLSQKFSLSGLQKVAYSDDIKKFFKEVVQDGLLVLRVTSLEDDNLPTCELYIKERNIKRILNEKMRELKNSALEDFPKVGDVENVLVTWVVSPQKFFVQLAKRDADLNALKQELEEVDTRGQMMTYQQLSVGFKCVCQYESDGNWYRAVITSVDSENAISVFYIDYGNTETVSISRLRKVDGPGLITQMGNQAVQCSLAGFENQPMNEELTKKLEALTLEKEFQMRVASSDKQLLCVNLFDDGKDIASLLLSQQNEPKKKEPEMNGYNPSNVWNSSESGHSALPNRSERENVYQVEESFEHRDRNYRSDQNRRKKQGPPPLMNFQSLQSPPRPKEARLKSRFDDRDTRRDNRMISRNITGGWGEQNFDQQKQWRVGAPKEFGDWDSSTVGGFKCPPRGRDEPKNRNRTVGNRGLGQTRNQNTYGDRNKSGDSRGRRYEAADREGKRFEVNRSWDSHRGGEETTKRRSGDRMEKFEEKKSSRIPIKKEDIAPPGSKFEERVIEIGSTERGIVTYYFSPDEFFVQLLADEEEFKKMMKDIQHYYSDKYSIRDPVQAGDIVIAQFSHDKILYRAEVIKPSPVTVRYIDYGNQEPVQPKGTWFVDKQFLKLPQQVIKCRLSGLLPLGSDWPPPGSAVDKFFEFAEYNCTFLGKEGDMYEISMTAQENGKDVASEIIAAGLGRPFEIELDVPETDYSLLQGQVLRLFVSHVESSSKFYVIVNPKALRLIDEATSGKVTLLPIDWSKIEPEMPCLATLDDVSWSRGHITKVIEENVVVWLSDRGNTVTFSKDKVMHLPEALKSIQPQAVQCCLHGISSVEDEENFKETVEGRNHLIRIISASNNTLSVILYDEEGKLFDFEKDCGLPECIVPIGELPIISQRLPLVVSHMDSLRQIYIQFIADESSLVKFLEQLDDFYSGKGDGWQEDEDIPVGTFVAAKSCDYDSWYRGRVTSSSSPAGELEIFYTDYGNRETLPRENIKKLDPSFFGVNAFSRAVALEGDFPADKNEDLEKQFWKACEDKDLVGYFKNKNGEIIIELRANEKRVADMLEIPAAASEPNPFVEITGKVSEKQSPDSYLKVFVSHINSPSCFWVRREILENELMQFQELLQKGCENYPDKANVKVDDVVASPFSGMWYRACVTAADGDTLKVQFIDYGNTSTVDLRSETVKQLPPEVVDVPAFATRFALKGSWDENSTPKFTDIILRNEDPLEVTILEKTDPVVVDLFQDGKSVTRMLEEELNPEEEPHVAHLPVVYITHIISPYDFYIRREIYTPALEELMERLADAPSFEDPPSVKVGQLYAAKCPKDGNWYRARVYDRTVGELSVFFVDRGNNSIVTEVKRLPDDLLHLAYFAENCGLIYGKRCDVWSEAACKLFAEYADGRPLRMKEVLKKPDRMLVGLFHENKSVSEELERLCRNDGRREVYVAHAVSPTDFYIQYVDDKEYKVIAEALKDVGGYDDLEERETGAMCQACFAEDGCWYRARILRDLGEEGCEVFFCDFGNVGVSKELKKLPAELEDIPPRAIKCSLDLPDVEVAASAVEEFINMTAAGAAVFRGKIISPGETNIVSLKLDGRIIEETLDLEERLLNGHYSGIESSKDLTEDQLGERTLDEIPKEAALEVSAEWDSLPEIKVNTTPGSDLRNKVHKIVPGSISRGEDENPAELVDNPAFRKLMFSEKLVPGSISRGISLESMAEERQEVTPREEKPLAQSAPNTPPVFRKSEYAKTDVNDRLVPGCISTGMPLHCSPGGEKTSLSEKIVPGAVNGSH